MPRGRSPARSLKSLVAGGLSFDYTIGSLFILVSDFFHWIAAGKVRTSIAAGAFAGLIVALGFMLFDLGREEWMLKQRYPNALHSYERHVLYARDLVLEKQYQKAEPILRKLVRNRGGTSLHSDALLLLGECLDKSARDTAASNIARGIYERFIDEYPADPRVPSVHLSLAENFARNELYSGSNAQYERYLRMVPDADRRDEVEFLVARNHYLEANLRKAVDSFEQVRQKYPGTTAAYDSTLLLAKAFDEFGKPDDAARVLSELVD
ncbi:MAG: tetratricopeptide repeat protein, partial [Candidatus Hydrogenedentota bacterium]